MKKSLNKSQIERFSRQLVLKDVGAEGQKKILSSKVLIVGVGGLGCPAAEGLVRAGIGTIGLIDNDIVSLSNIHRQSLFNSKDIKKTKVNVAEKRLKEINPLTKIKTYKSRLDENNISVLNTPGTIDSDYRGEIKIILFNHSKENFTINNNDRVAQMVLTPIIKMDLEETNELPESIRGEGGFGSTGK